MAVSVTSSIATVIDSSASSYTASGTVTQGKFLMALITKERGDSTSPTASMSIADSFGSTWELVDAFTYDTGGTWRARAEVWSASAASGGTMAVTATCGETVTRGGICMIEVTGTHGTSATALRQVKYDHSTSTRTSATITAASAFASTASIGVYLVTHTYGEAMSTPTGGTELADVNAGGVNGMQVSCGYQTNDTSFDFSWTANVTWYGLIAEIIEAVGVTVGGSITPTGTLVKAAAKLMAGSITPTGTWNYAKSAVAYLAGAITPTGTLVKATTKLFGGSITPTGGFGYARVRRLLTAVAEGTLSLMTHAADVLGLTSASDSTLTLTPLDEGSANLTAQSESSLQLTELDEENA